MGQMHCLEFVRNRQGRGEPNQDLSWSKSREHLAKAGNELGPGKVGGGAHSQVPELKSAGKSF